MPDGNNRSTTSRTVKRVRVTRVHRSPEDTVALWRPRGRRWARAAAVWLVIAIIFALTGGGTLVVGMTLAAAVASAVVAIKAAVLVNRNSGESG